MKADFASHFASYLVGILFGCVATAMVAVATNGCGSDDLHGPPPTSLQVSEGLVETERRCEKEFPFLPCSTISSSARSRLTRLGCKFHPVFTAYLQFHCFFATEPPTNDEIESCVAALEAMDSCTEDGVVTADELPASCTTEIGLDVSVRY